MLKDASDPESQAAPGPSWMRVGGGADRSQSEGSMDGGMEEGRGEALHAVAEEAEIGRGQKGWGVAWSAPFAPPFSFSPAL